MNSKRDSQIPLTWIVGVGNTQRRDDGIGRYVVQRLQRHLKTRNDIRLLGVHQLGPELAETLKDAAHIVFVDAVADHQADGVAWASAREKPVGASHSTHFFTPSLLMDLIGKLYLRHPPAWVVAIKGEDFDFGEGLSDNAAKRVALAIDTILAYLADRQSLLKNLLSV